MDGPPDLQMNRPSGPRQYLRPKVTSHLITIDTQLGIEVLSS